MKIPGKILVTGGAGFIGSNYIRYVQKRYGRAVTVVNLDKLTYAGSLDNLMDLPFPDRHIFVKGDIADPATVNRVFKKHRPGAVVHFAAETHVDRSIFDPFVFLKTNVNGTAVLLEAALTAWKASPAKFVRFLHVSTDEVYGSLGSRGRSREGDPLRPRSPYSASKASSDLLVRSYGHTYGLPVTVTRCSNNYGPYQFPEKFIPVIIERALAHQPIPVYGDGRNVRDWIFVEDHCRALDLVLHRGRSGSVYNIGGLNERQNIHLVKQLLKIISKLTADRRIGPRLIRFVTDRPGHDRRYSLDPSLIRSELGWSAATGFPEGLERTVRWYCDNAGWLKKITSGDHDRFMAVNYRER
jgi:dTDP-glucose 4,6-dehydratase